MELAGKNAVVVGLARSGLAAIQLLRERGARVTACDIRPLAEMPEAGPALREWNVPFVPQSEESLAGFELIVISPGVPADLPELEAARRRGATVVGELELAAGFLAGKTIGITGSNGKTTTTALVGHILQQSGIPAQVGGNIGRAPAAMIATSRPGAWNVLELSSFQLETIRDFRAHIAVALNVTPDHLDRHRTFKAYAAVKARLFETQQAGDFAVLNADDPTCLEYAALTRGRPLWFSLHRPVTPGLWLRDETLLFDGEALMPAAEIPLRGRHNIENVMAAAAAARLAGADLKAIAAAVRAFPGVEHRLELVCEIDGISFYNDSKATNVDAALKAVDAFAGGLWIILGGKDKGSDYTPLRRPLSARAVAALLVGGAAPIIAAHLGDAVPLVECGTLDVAVRRAFAGARPGDTVLLAPACASFDQFENYEHRGRVFKSLVRDLKGDKGR